MVGVAAEGRCRLQSATLRGVEALPVTVEVSIGNGMPGFAIVGMADAAIQESRERVKAAIKASGFGMPTKKIVVNLAPSSLRKNGSGFDLPIALGILIASHQLDPRSFDRCLIIGELSLEGGLRSVRGILAYELCARELGLVLMCSYPEDGVVPIEGLELLTPSDLSSFREEEWFDRGRAEAAARLLRAPTSPAREQVSAREASEPDFREVGGCELAKRALQVAAAGMHGVLMIGSPGSGKTMLASRTPSIMTELTEQEMLETARVHSVAGEDLRPILARQRPFRAPHHTVSAAGLLGGGSPMRPGEISLAHNGVLFLDELAEFKPSLLQGLRQPLETSSVTIVRADGAVQFPARFMLVAATNPCPCGFYGDPKRVCRCSPGQVHSYQSRIGGPLLDRLDIQINVGSGDFDTVAHDRQGLDSARLKAEVCAAQEFRRHRLRHGQASDAKGPQDLMAANAVDPSAESFLREVARRFDLSGRGIVRCVRVARTIADLAQQMTIDEDAMAEAVTLRLREA